MSTWRDQFKVHPAADIFPMMSDEELAELGEDIKANGLHQAIVFSGIDRDREHLVLLDGRNRLEAAERAGIELPCFERFYITSDPVAFVISANIRRRHLTKQQQGELIVAAVLAEKKPPQDEEVSKGGRGKVNQVKAKAVAAAKEHGISKATIERAFADARKTSEQRAADRAIREHQKRQAQRERKRAASLEWRAAFQKRKQADEADPEAAAARRAKEKEAQNAEAVRETEEAQRRHAQWERSSNERRINREALQGMAQEIISAGYRALAVKYHPDKGGSAEQMAQLNAANAMLKARKY